MVVVGGVVGLGEVESWCCVWELLAQSGRQDFALCCVEEVQSKTLRRKVFPICHVQGESWAVLQGPALGQKSLGTSEVGWWDEDEQRSSIAWSD